MMFKKLCAAALLVLVALPFTAPFQTYDLAATSDVGVAAFLLVVAEPAAEVPYDSRLDPSFRHSGRWRTALAVLAGSQFPEMGAATFRTIFPATPRHTYSSSVRNTVLRL